MPKHMVINLQLGVQEHFYFDGLAYVLSSEQITNLIERGMLLVTGAPTIEPYGCHRCRLPFHADFLPKFCPYCNSETWNTYTLLYCSQCHALFEHYWHLLAGGNPYDRFPKCPSCGSEHWCPAEEERLKSLPPEEVTQAQAQVRREAEKEAYTRLMALRKQQEFKRLGLSSTSRQAPLLEERNPLVRSHVTDAEEQERIAARDALRALYALNPEEQQRLSPKKKSSDRGMLSTVRRWFSRQRP